MWVKICGNTTLADAQLAADAGADALGFILAPSRRRITSEAVAAIVQNLRGGAETVGVFTTDDAAEIASTIANTGLGIAQVHRPYDAEFVRTLSILLEPSKKIMQTVAYAVDAEDRAASDRHFVSELATAAKDEAVWAVLIDAAKGAASGGLGVAFDWKHVGSLVHAALSAKKPIVLAGGLTPGNVAEAIGDFGPWGVDIASGVEESIGVKSAEKVAAFVRAARTR